MFCGECGAKNQKDDLFCSECGAPLVKEETKKVTNNVVKKPRQPMSKKNKIILGIVVFVVAILGIGYKVGSNITNPKKIAKDYIEASINQDGNKLYKYLELEGDTTFVSKKIFNNLLKENDSDTTVENYKVTGIEYGDGKLTAKVSYTYTVKDSSSEKTGYINLTKQKSKKFLIFDNWKVSNTKSSSSIIENYTLKVTKGSTVTYAGVEVKDKYLDSEQSTSKLDVYVLPQVFAIKTTLKAVLPNGMEIEESVTPSSYSHTISFNENSLTDAAKEKIINTVKDSLTTVYTNAIAKKEFSEIKSNFEHGSLDLSNLETSYNDFLDKLGNATNTLTSITFNDLTLYDLDLDDDGNLEVEVKATYNYTVSYTSYNNEEKTTTKSSYDYMTVTLAYDDSEYHLIDINDLETYFYR